MSFYGLLCETEIKAEFADHGKIVEGICEVNPCLNDGFCFGFGASYKCYCKNGFEGLHCENPAPFSNKCENQICLHGGICQKNHLGSESCVCQTRFTGENCEKLKSDPCLQNRCRNYGVCFPDYEFENYQCICSEGYFGEFCEHRMESRIWINPCQNGKISSNSSDFKCECEVGFSGKYCEINDNDCKFDPCQNDGICHDLVDDFFCSCPAGFTGRYCEIKVENICQLSPCSEDEKCFVTDIYGGYRCEIKNDTDVEKIFSTIFTTEETSNFENKTKLKNSTESTISTSTVPSTTVSSSTVSLTTVPSSTVPSTTVSSTVSPTTVSSTVSSTTVSPTTVSSLESTLEYSTLEILPEIEYCPSFCQMRKSDGVCDEACNTVICGFDGGDCISESDNQIIEIVFEFNPDSFDEEKADFLLFRLNSVLKIPVSYVTDENGEIEAFRWTRTSGRKNRIILDQISEMFEKNEFVQIFIKVEKKEKIKDVFQFLKSLNSEKSTNLFGAAIAEARLDSKKTFEKDESIIGKILFITVFLLFLIVVVGVGKKQKIVRTTAVHFPGISPEDGKIITQNHFQKSVLQPITKYSTKLHQMLKDKNGLTFIPEDLIPFINAVDEEGRTCVHLSILSSEKSESTILSEIRLLESHGAQLDVEDDSDSTPLHYSIKLNLFLVTDYLIDKVNINSPNDKGETPLYLAVCSGSGKIVEKLLKKPGIDVNGPIGNNDNVLKKCARIGDSHLDILNLLLSHPLIDLNSVGDKRKTDCRGRTPLHEAVSCGNFEIVKILIQKNANISSKDFKKRTPLFFAIENNRIKIAYYLIEKILPQDLNEEDEDGITASQFASEKGLHDLASAILRKSAKNLKENRIPTCRDPCYSTQVGSYTVHHQNPEVLQETRKSRKRRPQWTEVGYPRPDYCIYQGNYCYSNQMEYNQRTPYSYDYYQDYCQSSVPSPYGPPDQVQYPCYQNTVVQNQIPRQIVFNNYPVYIQQNYSNPYNQRNSPSTSQSTTDSLSTDTSGYISDPSTVGNSSFSTYADLCYKSTKLDTDQFFKKMIQ